MPSKTLSQISQLSLQSRSARQRLASSSSRPSTALSTAPSSVNSTHSVSSVSLSRPLTARSVASRPGTARSARTRTPTAVNTTVLHGQYIVALYESKSLSNEVGLCAVDLTTSECILCQFMDSRTYSKCLFKLGIYQPVEILIPIHALEPTKTKLCVLLEDHFSEVPITPIARKYFNDKTGMSLIQKYGLEEYVTSLQLALESKYLCLATAAAALKYIEATESISFSARSMRFRYQTIEGSMMMDTATAKNLELVANLSNPKSKGSLFGVLNETKTKMGLRMLRTNILQPSVDEGTLNTRLDAVAELLSNDELRTSIQSTIKDITDLDVVISNIIQIRQKNSLKNPEQNINNVIYVKHTLELIKVLRVSLNGVRSELLKAVCKILHDPSLDYITTHIDHVINPDITLQKSPLGLRNQRCYAVKSGFNGLLDVARQTYKETTNDIYELVNTYNEEYGLNIKLVFKQSQGFVMSTSTENLNRRGGHQNRRLTENAETQDEDSQLDESEINGVVGSRCGEKRLPLIFCNVVKKGKTLWFSSLDLMKYNDRLNESLMEVFLMSDRTISDLITKFRSKIGSLYKVSESLAMLDMLSSFATSAKANRYVRPEFSDTLAIKAGRHPIREKLASEGITGGTGKFVPNDTYANNSTSFQVITGPNMSGKSTYLRQIALLCVMGQIGSFVPASYASLRITNHLFTRLSLDDSQETNASTFMLEMREIGYILQSITPSHSSSSSSDAAGGSEVMSVSEGGKSNGCLVLIDELGRGTSTYDGVGIAWAVCEELRNGKAFVFFATHFEELPVALEIFPNVVNLHLEVQVDASESKLRYLYTLRDGRCEEEHYGLRLAKSLNLPGGVIETAEEIAGWLTQKINEQKAKSVASKKVKLQKLFLQLSQRLITIKNNSSLSLADLRPILVDLQKKFIKTYDTVGPIPEHTDETAESSLGSQTGTNDDSHDDDAPVGDVFYHPECQESEITGLLQETGNESLKDQDGHDGISFGDSLNRPSDENQRHVETNHTESNSLMIGSPKLPDDRELPQGFLTSSSEVSLSEPQRGFLVNPRDASECLNSESSSVEADSLMKPPMQPDGVLGEMNVRRKRSNSCSEAKFHSDSSQAVGLKRMKRSCSLPDNHTGRNTEIRSDSLPLPPCHHSVYFPSSDSSDLTRQHRAAQSGGNFNGGSFIPLKEMSDEDIPLSHSKAGIDIETTDVPSHITNTTNGSPPPSQYTINNANQNRLENETCHVGDTKLNSHISTTTLNEEKDSRECDQLNQMDISEWLEDRSDIYASIVEDRLEPSFKNNSERLNSYLHRNTLRAECITTAMDAVENTGDLRDSLNPLSFQQNQVATAKLSIHYVSIEHEEINEIDESQSQPQLAGSPQLQNYSQTFINEKQHVHSAAADEINEIDESQVQTEL